MYLLFPFWFKSVIIFRLQQVSIEIIYFMLSKMSINKSSLVDYYYFFGGGDGVGVLEKNDEWEVQRSKWS